MRCRYCGAMIRLNIECTVIRDVCDSCLMAFQERENGEKDKKKKKEKKDV